jgi:hypothetical protein
MGELKQLFPVAAKGHSAFPQDLEMRKSGIAAALPPFNA